MNERVEQQLKECETIDQMFNVLKKNYVLENSRPGLLVKNMVISGLKSAIKMLRPEERK